MKMEKAVGIVAGIAGLYQLLIASRLLTWFGFFMPAAQHRAICLMFGFFLIFAMRSAKGEKRAGNFAWYDIPILIAGLIGAGFVTFNYSAILDYSNYGFLDFLGMVMALLLMVSLLEAARRVAGLALPIIVVFFLLLTIFQNYLPGLLLGKGFGFDELSYSVYVGTGGIFGIPLGVATTILITFIVFGKLLQTAGAGQFFINIAMIPTGWMRGGVGKATVFATCLFGMVSGSPTAAVATVGSITIPMMIDTGYKPKFAAAVQAVAGTGGQFMPPVMGAIAFIMAEWLQIPYTKIAIAAFIPAVLYFFVLFMSIHFEAIRLNLKPTPKEDIQRFSRVLRTGWYYFLPLAVLIYLLIFRGYPPEMAGLFSCISVIAVSFLSKDKKNHLTPSKIWSSIVDGSKIWITLCAVTAAVGMMIGALELSGVGIRFSGFILSLTQNNLLLTLIFIGCISFILGMGLDSIPAYFTLVILAAPALIDLGIEPMIAHLYVVYWGLASFIVPPVALAIFVACGISGSKIWETGWEGVRIGICSFIIPFAFVYNQALLWRGSFFDITSAVATATVGGIFVASAMRGTWQVNLTMWQRALMFIGGLLLIGPTTILTAAGGFILGTFTIISSTISKKKLSAEAVL